MVATAVQRLITLTLDHRGPPPWFVAVDGSTVETVPVTGGLLLKLHEPIGVGETFTVRVLTTAAPSANTAPATREAAEGPVELPRASHATWPACGGDGLSGARRLNVHAGAPLETHRTRGLW